MNLKVATMKQYIIFSIIMIAMMNISYCSADGKTFFITPSSSIPYPTNFCFTASQFARNSSSLLSYASNATLTFLKGNRTLDTNFSVAGISRFQMIANSFSGGAHTISSSVAYAKRVSILQM